MKCANHRRPLLAITAACLLSFAGGAITGHAQTQPQAQPPGQSSADDAWRAILEPAMDPAKTTPVENLVLTRDAIRLTLTRGTLQFTKPVEGKLFGAVFRGRGLVEVAPPNRAEEQQLHEYTGQDTLSLAFTDGVLWFTDKTYEEVATQAHWLSSVATPDSLFAERTEREGSPRARLLKGILSLDHERTALFEADLNTAEKGWIQVTDDSLEPEEISIGRWDHIQDLPVFVTWMSFPSHSRSVEAAFRDPMAKADFHVASYQIDATIEPTAELQATVRAHLEMLASGERVIEFRLDPHLRVDRVTDDGGHTLEFFQPPDPGGREAVAEDFLSVVLAQPSSFQPTTIEFHYAGKHVISKVGAGNFFCESFGWYPAVENEFATRSDFDLTFRSQKRYTLAATGDEVDETTDGDLSVTKWKSSTAISVAGFALGEYKVEEQRTGDTRILVYANRNPDDVFEAIKIYAPDAPLGSLSPASMSKTMGIELGNMIRVFENYYGPYPFHSLAITNIPGDYGQGWPGLIYLSAISFLDQTQQDELGLQNLVWLGDYWRGHETSHQWWGHKVGWKSYHDQWLSEGFAQFSGNLYVEYRDSWKDYLRRIREDREELLTTDLRGRTYESLGPIWMGERLAPPDEPQAYQIVVYNKGGYVLHMLRMMLYDPTQQDPDANFKAMMQDYTQTYNNNAASTGQFKAIVEKHMLPRMDLDGNHRMDWFFNEYVYGTGVPQYHFNCTTTPTGDGKTKVSLVGDRTGVPQGWKDSLPIYAYRSGKPFLVGWMAVTGEHGTTDFILPFAPEKIVINANEDILAIIKQ